MNFGIIRFRLIPLDQGVSLNPEQEDANLNVPFLPPQSLQELMASVSSLSQILSARDVRPEANVNQAQERIPPEVPAAVNLRNQFDRLFNSVDAFSESLLFLVKKPTSPLAKPFSEQLLTYMIEARDYLLQEKLYTEEEIVSMGASETGKGSYAAVRQLALFHMLNNAALGKLGDNNETITFKREVNGKETIALLKCNCKSCFFEMKDKLVQTKKMLLELNQDETTQLKKLLTHVEEMPNNLPPNVKKAFHEIGALETQLSKSLMNDENVAPESRVDWQQAYQVPGYTPQE